MKAVVTCILILLIPFVTGCKKEDNPDTSGTITINNKNAGTAPTYYINGFHVPTGTIIADLNNQLDIITINPDFDVNYNPLSLYFSTNNFRNSFYKYGSYPDEQSAINAFNNLTSFTSPQWTDMGANVAINQIWLYRTDDDRYAKLRIISTIMEKRPEMIFPYSECTFEWVFQTDGSQTFPAK